MPYFEHNARCYCDLQNMNVWDVRSAEKVRSKEGDRKSPDVVNWAADPFLCDARRRGGRAAAVLPRAHNGNCQSCNPFKGCLWNREGRPTDCLLAWLVLGWQTSSQPNAAL